MTDIVLLAQQMNALQECMINIRLSTEEEYRLIVVVENNQVQLLEWLQQNTNVEVITVPPTIGVAEGFNIGAMNTQSDRVVFMRDHMYVTDGWLTRLHACMDIHSNAGMIGPTSNGLNGPQHFVANSDNTAKMLQLAHGLGGLRKGRSVRVTRLLSHFIMVRKSVFDELNGFDTRFTGEGFEDDDFSYRMLLAGYDLYVAQDCYIRFERKWGQFVDQPRLYQEQLQRNQQIAQEIWGFDLTEALHNWKWPITISLCMIVKNEEQTLERCLSSVANAVDEIIIVDTGSEDRTKEIAKSYTNHIYDFQWIDDFSAARNFAFQQATQSYILWLDADDILLPEDNRKLCSLKNAFPSQIDAVSMLYVLSRDESGGITASIRRNRLVKRSRSFKWIGAVHEYLEVFGSIDHSDIQVTHNRIHTQTMRNLNVYERMENNGTSFSTRDLYYYANELFDHSLWEKALGKYDEFLARSDGWLEDRLQAYGRSADCLHKLGRREDAKRKSLLSFTEMIPRAEMCCRVGYYFLEEEKFEEAVYWYHCALSAKRPADSYAWINESCWTWLPHLQLCVCYDKLGWMKLANEHNEVAASYIPEHQSIIANRHYFKSLL